VDLQNSFTAAKSSKFPTKPILGQPPHLKCVAALHYLGKLKNQKFCILMHVKHVSNVTFYHLSKRCLPNVLKINVKINTMQNTNILLFVRSRSLSEGMLNCGMARFPTGHYWHCSWPVKNASPGMCPCKWWTFWTFFVNKLLQTISIFRVFLVQVASIHRVSFLLCWCLKVDRPTMVQSFKLVKGSERTKSKMLIFFMVLIFALILTTFGISFSVE